MNPTTQAQAFEAQIKGQQFSKELEQAAKGEQKLPPHLERERRKLKNAMRGAVPQQSQASMVTQPTIIERRDGTIEVAPGNLNITQQFDQTFGNIQERQNGGKRRDGSQM